MPSRSLQARPLVSYPGDLVEHLRAFETLAAVIDQRAATNTFARAAANLSIDTSVLRRRLQTLTEFVGSALLIGRGSSLRLTSTGLRVRALAAKMTELAAELSAPREDEGPLRVACTGTILAEVLPAVLASMRKHHDQLRLQVRRAGSEAARGLLEKGEIDFAIVRSTSEPGGGLEARHLAQDHLWLAYSSRSALARARRLSLADVAKEPLIGYSSTSSTMRRVLGVLGPLGATPWIEVDRKAAALAYVEAELGVAFVSLAAGQKPTHKGVIARDVTSLFPRVAFWLVWRPDAPLTGWRSDFAVRIAAAMRPHAAERQNEKSP